MPVKELNSLPSPTPWSINCNNIYTIDYNNSIQHFSNPLPLPSPSDYFTQARMVSVLSTDSDQPPVNSDTGLEEIFEGKTKKKDRLLDRLAKRQAAAASSGEGATPDSPDSLGRVTPLPDNSDSGLDSGT